MMDEFSCDIAYVLQNRDFSILQKLMSHYSNCRTKTAAKACDIAAYKTECAEKKTLTVNKISELQQDIVKLKAEIDAIKLEQKIVGKKILNAVQQQEKLKDEVAEEKSKRDILSLEMVDLQLESEKRKDEKLLKWNAIKRACYTYKQHLDLHIHLENFNESNRIKVSFFIHNPLTKDKYYVYLVNSTNCWNVEEIQPALKKEHLNGFKGIIDFSKEWEVADITAFLCNLRQVFVEHYVNAK